LFFSCTDASDKKQSVEEKETLLDAVLRPVASNVLSKISIVSPVNQSLPVYTEVLGYLDYDNYSRWDISSRYSGRIEKLYVKYNYQPVKKGQILFEVYSPDLVTAQENFLYVLKNSPQDSGLMNAARQKLKLLQLTDEQIKQIETSGKAIHAIPVFSKYDGHIHEVSDSKMAQGDMGDYQKNALLSVKEGMYVEREEVLFNVVNPDKIVAMLQIKSDDIGKVKLKQAVSFYINNDSSRIMNGKVDFIEPTFTSNSKTLMARVNITNTNMLKVGSLVNAKIIDDTLKSLWIPVTAIVDLGKNKIVWVSENGYFKAKKVETGMQSGNMIQITSGLTAADKIAAEAHFLSDSEDFIKTNGNE
jgi:Cu(I)/Ag(I) efflux system membrane fusion protein